MKHIYRETNSLSFLAILILSLTTLFSCSYKPTDEYFRDLSTVPPGVTIYSSFGTDTIVMNDKTYFDIQIDAGGTHEYYLEVLINDTIKFSSYSPSGYFDINPSSFAERGIFPIHFNFYFNTKTGSIADALGAEAFLVQKDMILVNNGYTGNDFYPTLTFSNVSGTLHCTLNVPPGGPPIRKIMVRKEFGIIPPFDLVTSTGVSPFNFQDDSYVGEKAYYEVKTFIGTNEGTYLYPSREGLTNKEKEIQPPVITIDEKGMPVIHWQKTAYTSNCNGYRIFNKAYWSDDLYEIATVNDINLTSLETSDIVFPGINITHVSYIPKNPPPSYNQQLAIENYSSSEDFSAGLSSFSYNRFFAPVGNDLFITDGYDHLLRYSAQTLELTQQITSPGSYYAVSVSPNNKYLLAATGTSDFIYLLYNIKTKEITYIPSNIVIGAGISSGGVSISDIGVAAVTGGNKIILYDFVHNNKLSELTFVQEPRAEISPSGYYFFVAADKLYLYGNSGGLITEKWHSTGGVSANIYYSFLPEDDTQAIVIENQTVSVRRCNDWSLLKSFPVAFSVVGNIDFNSRRILGYDTDYIRIYDFDSGNLLKQLRVGTSSIPLLKFRGTTIFYGGAQKLILF